MRGGAVPPDASRDQLDAANGTAGGDGNGDSGRNEANDSGGLVDGSREGGAEVTSRCPSSEDDDILNQPCTGDPDCYVEDFATDDEWCPSFGWRFTCDNGTWSSYYEHCDLGSEVCENPQELFQWGITPALDDFDSLFSGTELCDDGSLHLQGNEACEQQYLPSCDCGDAAASDASLADAASCEDGGPAATCLAQRGCTDNEDCAEGEICLCSAGYGAPDAADSQRYDGNRCVPAECWSDSDCEPYGCFVSVGCGFEGVYCHTSDDLCHSDLDCEAYGDGGRSHCAYNGAYWECRERSSCD
jgi:hypothetical protein